MWPRKLKYANSSPCLQYMTRDFVKGAQHWMSIHAQERTDNLLCLVWLRKLIICPRQRSLVVPKNVRGMNFPSIHGLSKTWKISTYKIKRKSTVFCRILNIDFVPLKKSKTVQTSSNKVTKSFFFLGYKSSLLFDLVKSTSIFLSSERYNLETSLDWEAIA